jgi:hypothetical protein
MLDDLAWMKGRIAEWFAGWERESAEGEDHMFRLGKALYFMRHTQHHIGKLSAIVRLLELDGPSWIYRETAPDSKE